MLDPFQSLQVVPRMINSDQTNYGILICFTRWVSSIQRVFFGFFRTVKPTVLRAMLILIFWKINIVKTTFKKNWSLDLFYEFSFAWSCILSFCCKIILSVRFDPMILCRKVNKLVKFDLCLKYVEGVLTKRLNLSLFFIFADYSPPTATIWSFSLEGHLFLTCSWVARVKKTTRYF